MKNKFISVLLAIFAFVFYAGSALAGTATVSWNANAESDLAGYKIYYGTGQRTGTDPKVCGLCGYASTINVGNVRTYTFNNLTDGQTYYFSVSAYDTSNNEGVFSTQVSKVVPPPPLTPDITSPTVSITSPSAGTVSGSITFSATASDPAVSGAVTSGLSLLSLFIDGSLYATSSTASISKSLDTTTLTNTSHTLSAQARDNAGNISQTITITITINNPTSAKFPRTVTLTSLEGLSSIPSNQPIIATILSGSSVLGTSTLTPNSSNVYTITFLPSDPQLVNIRIKATGFLSQTLSNIDTTVNSASALSIPQLLAGDNNNDNVINTLDYSVLNTHWNQNYPIADINQDGLINSLDFAVLKNNWNKAGE